MKNGSSTLKRFISIPFLALLIFGASPIPCVSQASDEIVAIVNNKNITEADIRSLIPARYLTSDPKRLHALRKTALENFIIRILLNDEAKRRRVSVETLRRQMTVGKVVVSNYKVEQEYRENAPYLGLMSPDEAKERLRLDLEIEARMQLYQGALSRLKAKAKIEIRLREPEIKRINVAYGEHSPKGSANAQIVIFEFSDFQCQFCRKSYDLLKTLVSDYKDNVKLIYKYFPLRTDSRALAPSIASYCAERQGRFWEFHDNLFTANDLSLVTIGRIANELKLNIPAFDACVASETAKDAVLSDLEEAIQLGIDSTPTFVINGKIYSGMLEYDEFKRIIEQELAEIQKKGK